MTESYVPVPRSEYEFLVKRNEMLERIESLLSNDNPQKKEEKYAR